jgi:hypothetical protein
VLEIQFFYDILDDASIHVKYVNSLAEKPRDYDSLIEQYSETKVSIKQYLGGWVPGGLMVPDFEKAFGLVAETLPAITQKCNSIRAGLYIK